MKVEYVDRESLETLNKFISEYLLKHDILSVETVLIGSHKYFRVWYWARWNEYIKGSPYG
jgi:DNA-binding transcriptional regulator/RsmH inhibitor MraZ